MVTQPRRFYLTSATAVALFERLRACERRAGAVDAAVTPLSVRCCRRPAVSHLRRARKLPPYHFRALSGASVLSGQALAIGGYDVQSCELYDARDDAWRTLDSLLLQPRAVHFTSAVTPSHHEVMLVGGYICGQSPTSRVVTADLRAAGQAPGSAWMEQPQWALPKRLARLTSVLLHV